MGVSHEWKFIKPFLDDDWARLGAIAGQLAADLPAYNKRQAKAQRARLKHFGGPPSALTQVLIRFASHLLGTGDPVSPGFPDGSYFGPSEDGSLCIRIGSSAESAFELKNWNWQFYEKTDAKPHALVWGALLCAAEALEPGNVHVIYSDWEDGVWEQAADWAAAVLERPMPTPRGLKCSPGRASAALAWNESRDLEEATPVPPKTARALPKRI